MIYFIVGLVVFLGIHSVAIVAPQWRDRMFERVGEGAWRGLYSVASIIGFVLLVWGYGQVRADSPVLYTPPASLRWLTAILMLPVFPLLLAAYFPGRIKTALKHPMLAAVKFWALAHLLSNGTLVDVLLFGGFLAWAVADRISFKRRVQGPIPSIPSRFNDVIVIVLGLILYFVFMHWLHTTLIGRSALPLPLS